jgi:hypothetical protein
MRPRVDGADELDPARDAEVLSQLHQRASLRPIADEPDTHRVVV